MSRHLQRGSCQEADLKAWASPNLRRVFGRAQTKNREAGGSCRLIVHVAHGYYDPSQDVEKGLEARRGTECVKEEVITTDYLITKEKS